AFLRRRNARRKLPVRIPGERVPFDILESFVALVSALPDLAVGMRFVPDTGGELPIDREQGGHVAAMRAALELGQSCQKLRAAERQRIIGQCEWPAGLPSANVLRCI